MKTQILKCRELTDGQIKQLAGDLSNGAVAVFATDTVYGIGTGALCESSVQKIYALKNRPLTQPLQLLVADLKQAQQIVVLTEPILRVAKVYWPGGLTLILPASEAGKPLLRGAVGLGLRIPKYVPLCQVLARMDMPLTSTSANLHGQSVLTDETTVIDTFEGRVDYILTDGILSPTASTVLDVTGEPTRLLREGSVSKEDLSRLLGAPIL
ncbi:MAG: threonylcarbamoyl-AMP synthase [Elusimicrobiaceae bacterium]|nr:threonylcarbamoyl-AMP synthase [Elusimicrobiaceae bacterium]